MAESTAPPLHLQQSNSTLLPKFDMKERCTSHRHWKVMNGGGIGRGRERGGCKHQLA